MKNSDGMWLILVVAIGVPVFLLFEHPIIFWIVFVPIVVFGVIKFIMWLKK